MFLNLLLCTQTQPPTLRCIKTSKGFLLRMCSSIYLPHYQTITKHFVSFCIRVNCYNVKQMIQNSRQRRAFDVVFLFAIKNRYKISLYKYTREMQHVVNPAPYRASYCSGVTKIWKDRIIQRRCTYMHTNNAIRTAFL